MTRALRPDEIAFVAQAACLFEASAAKPGNVSPGRDFGDTSYQDFLVSAAAIGPAFAKAGAARVGETVLGAVAATRRVVRANTNLGIVLLLAPLARAAADEGGPLRERLSRVLASLTLADARDVHAAIRLVAPGGLGTVGTEDVREEPTLTLRETMALAADRDSVAREYVTDYDVTFGIAAPAVRRARAAGLAWTTAAVEAHLQTLAQVPDTLIARKQGLPAAEAVSARAREVLAAGAWGSPERERAEAAFDSELRGPGNASNPGTTADLVSAALFVALAEEL